MTTLPRVIRAEHLGGHRLRLTFSDRTVGSVDCRRWLRGRVFEPLRNPAYFARVFVEGESVAWPNGADIAPEALYVVVKRLAQRRKASATVRGTGKPRKVATRSASR